MLSKVLLNQQKRKILTCRGPPGYSQSIQQKKRDKKVFVIKNSSLTKQKKYQNSI